MRVVCEKYVEMTSSCYVMRIHLRIEHVPAPQILECLHGLVYSAYATASPW